MGATPVTEAERGAVGVDPDGDRSFWVLGMLIRFKAMSEETGGEYSLFEATVPPGLGAPPTSTTGKLKLSTCWKESPSSSEGRAPSAGRPETSFRFRGARRTASRTSGRDRPGS